MTIFTVFFRCFGLNLPASLQSKNTRVGPFPWKRSVLQNPDRERTNQNTGICLRLGLPYNNQRHYPTKRLIRDLLSNMPNCYVRVGELFRGYSIYLRGMRDRSMRSGTELAREIKPTDWSTAAEQGFSSAANVSLRGKKFQNFSCCADAYTYHICRAWYNGSYTMATKPIKFLELHYTMTQS